MNEQVIVAEAPVSTPGERGAEATRTRRVLAVASGGGHWVQLKRLWQAFDGHEVTVVTTHAGYGDEVRCKRFRTVTDANMDTKLSLVRLAWQMAWIVFRERPDVVISTGAAPGYFAIRFGKLIRARTIWVDSLANAEKLSLSGLKVGPHADLWLTQWEHLAQQGGPYYYGSVA
ncbi:UDP-N-acetylglucosamine--LPS N-acetylglucosamine transferase [Phycisphaerales bacterium AB-hyl4]|uniref:UDP-N-acetylglucosamine--LPS N-acetylglucosamine transferase n=1 Tax=Natronomicrosphaera hydrolytica TaxID=3242702 RepID=A0ABV4U3M4_9BACT